MDSSPIKKTTLDNGVRVVTETIGQLKSVSVGIWVGVGARDESDEEAGLTHFIEHMIFKGTERRSCLDISKELDSLGGLYNAFTNKEFLWLYAKMMDEHLVKGAEVLSDIFLNSVFPDEEVIREKSVILQEIQMLEDTPDDHAHLIFQGEVYRDNPLARPIFGTAQTVAGFSREHALRFFHQHFTPDRIILCAAGNVVHEELVELLGGPFSRVDRNPAGPPKRVAPNANSSLMVFPRDTGQVLIFFGVRGPSYLSEDRYPCSLINVILGANSSSRLLVEIRERLGLAYSVGSYLSANQDVGLMQIFSGVAPGNTRETLEVVRREIRRLKHEPVSDEELVAAKEYIKGVMYLQAESSDHRMTRLAKNEMYLGRIPTYEEILKKLEKVTAKDLMEFARKVFDPATASLLLYGPVDGSEEDFREFLDI